MNKFFHGSSILSGNSTIPGVELTPELKKYIPVILKACRDYGLDFYPTIVQLCTYDEISEIAAYGGFPKRYQHWKWGMEWEEMQRGYEYGLYKIYEMVINTDPCVIYNLYSNTLLDHLTVVAHATGHNDFFKNNIHFSATNTNMLNKMANHATRIGRYRSRHGAEKVTQFIDHVLRLDTLIDPAKAWNERKNKEICIVDKKEYRYPSRLKVDPDRAYMDSFINTQEFKDKQNEKIRKEYIADELGLFQEPTQDILGFLRDNAPLKPWQQDIVSMLYEESLYFYPQGQTKTLNEGWASRMDSEIMAKQGYVSLGQKTHDAGIIEYARHKMGVLGGKYSVNPYKLGYSLLLDIEDRWNKGRFGTEWENCTDLVKKKNWDTNANLGKEKIFEVRKYYDDVNLIHEFFTEDFCREQEWFNWKHYPGTGETKYEDADYKKVKSNLIKRHLNRGLPVVKLTEPNYRGRGYMLLQHEHDGRMLHDPYAKEVMTSIQAIWGNDVHLATKNKDNEEIVYSCYGPDVEEDIEILSAKEHANVLGYGSKRFKN